MPYTREKEMYEAVKSYFLKSLGCEVVVADSAADAKKFKLLRNLRIRRPDVIGMKSNNEIYIAEGKLLTKGAAPFESCVSQACSLKVFADYCYVFFPKSDWTRLSQDEIQYNQNYATERGVGIILVDEPDNCREILMPRYNPKKSPKKRKEAIELLNDIAGRSAAEPIPSSPRLSPSEAGNANRLLSMMMAVERDILRNLAKKLFRKARMQHDEGSFQDFGDSSYSTKAQGFILCKHYSKDEKILIEIDPFGQYLKDGHPCLWVSAQVGYDKLRSLLSAQPRSFGTHIYIDYGERDETRPIFDVKEQDVTSYRTSEADVWLCHKAEVFGREREGLESEIAFLVAQARKIRSGRRG